jgi:hypothetical protein
MTERRIEFALRPGHFIHDRACFSFVRGLEEIAAGIRKLISSDPARAVALCETFLAGCHAKADEVDDSSGSFGQFAQDLICLWITARQASGADAGETASTLLAWMDDDPYAFCYRIEKDAAAALDHDGLAAFERRIRARLETGELHNDTSYAHKRLGEILRAVYLQQGVPHGPAGHQR